MKKLEKFINPSELFTSIFLLISITFTVIISLVIANRQEPLLETRAIVINNNITDNSLNLGEYKIRKYKYDRYSNSYSFAVKSGVDFYNEVIKTNEHYDESLDFSNENNIDGFMWNDFNLYNYRIGGNFVRIRNCYACGAIKVKFQDELYNEHTLCPAPFEYLVSKEQLEDKINDEINYNKEVFKNYTEEEMNSDIESIKNRYTKGFGFSFDEIKRIYNNSNSEYYKVLDDCILIKARYEDGDFNKKITDDYYAKIVDENGTPTIYKINDDRDIIY